MSETLRPEWAELTDRDISVKIEMLTQQSPISDFVEKNYSFHQEKTENEYLSSARRTIVSKIELWGQDFEQFSIRKLPEMCLGPTPASSIMSAIGGY